jgi:hypothetical protein
MRAHPCARLSPTDTLTITSVLPGISAIIKAEVIARGVAFSDSARDMLRIKALRDDSGALHAPLRPPV